MKTFNEEVTFNAPITFNALAKELVGILNGVTPSVKGTHVFTCSVLVETVTNFAYGATGQSIQILGNGNKTISHNANIKTNTAANKVLVANKIYTFTMISNVWYEAE